MRKVHALATAAAVVAAFGAGVIFSQGGAQAAGTLTGADIAEIEQLYARYNQGLDFKDKELFLSAFADDAVYTTGAGVAYEGRAGLEEWLAPVMENSSGAPVTHNNTSILITPTADGAKGRGYWMLMNVADREPKPVFSGYYEDTFVKTADGWRIQTRGSVRGWPQDSQ